MRGSSFYIDESNIHRKRRVSTTDKPQNGQPLKETPAKLRKFEPAVDINELNLDNWSWRRNKEISPNYVQHVCPKTVFFHQNYSHGTAAALGDRQLTKEMIAYWEINIEFVYGTAMMCGIGKKESKLLSPILFETLIGGEDANSYGLSHKGYLYHGGPVRKYCETAKDREPLVIGVLFDGPRRELSYFVNGVYMGVAFYDLALDGAVFYPMISSTSQKSQFVVSQQRCRYTIPSLTEKCLSLLVMRLHCSTKNHIKALGLPDQLSNLLYTRVQQYQGSTQKDTTSFAKELSCTKGEEAMEQEPSRIHQIFSPSSNEWDYGILSGLPPTIGENLMRILWARSTPSQF